MSVGNEDLLVNRPGPGQPAVNMGANAFFMLASRICNRYRKQPGTSKTLINRVFFLPIISALFSFGSADAESTQKRLDESHPLYNLVGQVSSPGAPEAFGQGIFIGTDGCHIVTNFHVAYATGVDSDGELLTEEQPKLGQRISFSFNLEDRTGKFRRRVMGSVVEFGTFAQGTTRGQMGDLAIAKLDTCQGKQFAGIGWDPVALERDLPTGELITVTAGRNSQGKNFIVAEESCQALDKTPAIGLVFSTCYMEPGMSANLWATRGADGTYRFAALGASHAKLASGIRVSIGISAKLVAAMVRSSGVSVGEGR